MPGQIDAVIVHCTSFNPVPSLAACVLNHFHMKHTTLAYTLSGMGCAASVVAIDLAQELLQNHRNMRVLIAGTENITTMLYRGDARSHLLTNCLFRLGLVGIRIGRDVTSVASRALNLNIRALAPLILPWSEKLVYAGNKIARKVFKAKIPEYTPDFKMAVDHFAMHPGGKAVIDTMEKALALSPEHAQPNRAAFERFGNTSSSSTWYAWSHIESFQGIKRGERLWQLAFGSGFKCNSAVWRALKTNLHRHDAWTDQCSC
ncbi:hypothetical protein WJX73_007415 [Symbiochloris irregularis]|uniref:very-long-chain 3-oxoacyl-CoA synthase n=1 Tax=Symbiochloris irregularis TaxID=706552 RepID=A0AAW1PWK6_9CHLO